MAFVNISGNGKEGKLGMVSGSAGSVDADYGSRLIADADARRDAVEGLTKLLAETKANYSAKETLRHGVSVIIPSFMGCSRIADCLRSVSVQTIGHSLFEVILIVNGPDDGTAAIAASMRDLFAPGCLRVIRRKFASAGGARNIGLSSVRFNYVTMVDDDDHIGPDFLRSLLEAAGPDHVAVSPIINVLPDGVEEAMSVLNTKIAMRRGEPFKFSNAPELIGFNACKLIPTSAIGNIRYDEALKSGEDICFMAAVAAFNDLNAVVIADAKEASYYRSLRADSISRQSLNFDFAVVQRLAVIRSLETLRDWKSTGSDQMLDDLINSQSNFIKGFLDQNPLCRTDVVSEIDSSGVKAFPWNRINKGLARDLAISYCFAPFADTSAVVASKALVERGKIVDVISNDMSEVRRVDRHMDSIAGNLVENSIQVDARASFSDWGHISDFVRKGLIQANRLDSRNGGYETVYSRVLWVGSHYLAALFKLRHPAIVWTAEFSDPLSTDVRGLTRNGSLVRDELWSTLQRGIRAKGFSGPRTDNLFEWCEYITYVLADEIVFTNDNQFNYMVSKIRDRKLQRLIREKAVVRMHPSPPERSYHIVESDYTMSPSVLNIGYFGAFYENRTLNELMLALANSRPEIRRNTRLHIFTDRPEDFDRLIVDYGLNGIVRAQRYRPYLEFLNLTTKFDVLVLNDVESAMNMESNPFLPSKYSDYKGAGVPMWALSEKGSALSRLPVTYASEVGNGADALNRLNDAYNDWTRRVFAVQGNRDQGLARSGGTMGEAK